MPSVCEGYRLVGGRSRRAAAAARPSSSGPTAGSRPATNMSATPTASIITAAAPATCCACRASGFRRPRSRMRWRAQASIAESAAVLGESEIGLAEIVLYVVPAAGADAAAATEAARERLAAGAAALQAAAPLRGGRRSAAHGDRQDPAPQAARPVAARSALGCVPMNEGGAEPLIRRRHVLYVEGYDPQGAEGYHNLFSRSFRRFLKNLAAENDGRRRCRSIPTISRTGPSRPPARTGRSRRATISCARSR